MTITFSMGMLFRGLLLAILVPLTIMSYVGGWKIFLDSSNDYCEKVGGLALWAASAMALFFTYLALVLPPISEWE